MSWMLRNVRVTSYETHRASASGGPGKTLQVIAPRDTFKQGQRIPKLTLQDQKGNTVALELAHVVQQRPARARAGGNDVMQQEWSIVYESIQRAV
ncbi:hypothetical protein [Erythrobacter sp. JK5]|uniref:hypothetical protein n=1 Tax=Erythrobacter sp. JK5 TaxID=2829500 RepID=UPI001BA8900B|nr:hypothetical protein [Erythrobacter sp. JK5]QUL38431.1 hypothetical protein KDC96_03185 [Erythrobacter sp. JK5]